MTRDHVAVVDKDGPYLDKDEENDEEIFVHGKDEGRDVIRERLSIAVYRMERKPGPR